MNLPGEYQPFPASCRWAVFQRPSVMPESLSIAELADLGLSPEHARKLADGVCLLLNGSPEHSWPAISKQWLPPDLPPAVYGLVHRFFPAAPLSEAWPLSWFRRPTSPSANISTMLRS